MRKIWIAVVLACSACATVPPPPAPVVSAACGKDASRRRGADDAAEGRGRDSAYLRLCPPTERDAFLRAYREGFEAAKKLKHREVEVARPEVLTTPAIARLPASPTWACEVEAASRVFTGVGMSEGEAAVAAKDACGAHFQTSSCGQTDCKKTL
jgi:hypothetical protein